MGNSMKGKRKRVILYLLLSFLVLSSCSNNQPSNGGKDPTPPTNDKEPTKPQPPLEEGSNTLTINLNVLNPEAKNDSYYVYFVIPGMKESEPGEATQRGKFKPFETDENGQVVIDFEENSWELTGFVQSTESTKPNSLELYVTTKEDIYLRNPLNEPTIVDFNVKEPGEGEFFPKITFKQAELNLDITDKYPDGVVSLTFQDAIFVVKLKFKEPPTTSFEVSLFVPDDKGDGIGIVRTGRISREFQYWDTPFFAGEIKGGKRAVVIKNFDTNETVNYEGYPLWLEFNEDGTCKQGDIVEIVMP